MGDMVCNFVGEQDIHVKQDFNQIMIKVHYFSCLSHSN